MDNKGIWMFGSVAVVAICYCSAYFKQDNGLTERNIIAANLELEKVKTAPVETTYLRQDREEMKHKLDDCQLEVYKLHESRYR